MAQWRMCRSMVVAFVIAGLVVSSPAAWAQLETADPALAAAVEALIAHDPDVAQNPELAALCREIAEATVLDPRERAAVAYEAAVLQREGVDVSTVISPEVRDAARGEFEKMQEQARQGLESLPPEERQRAELMMQEASRQFDAWEGGERYVPSEAMRQEAEHMFNEWAETASPDQRAFAERMFTEWSAGEIPGPGFGGMEMGAGHEVGPGNMPSLEQMQAMGMSAEQIQMAQEHMPQGGMMPEGMMPEGFGPGPGQEFQGTNPTEAFEAYAAEHQLSPETEVQYRELAETYQHEFENQNYDTTQSTNFDTFQPPPGGSTPPPGENTPPPSDGPHTLAQDNPPGQEDGWDSGDADSAVDHTHPEGFAPH